MIRKILLFLLLPVCAFGQESYWRFENDWTDDMGNHDGESKMGADFGTTLPLEGTYRADFNMESKNRMSTVDKIDLSSGGVTISFGLLFTATSGGGLCFTNMAGYNTQGIAIYADYANLRIEVRMSDGVTLGTAYSANSSLTRSAWRYVTVRFMDMTGANAKIFISGVASGTDTVGIAGAERNDTIAMGAFRSGNETMYGYMDNVSIYKCALSDSKIADLYTNRASNYTVSCSSTNAAPTASSLNITGDVTVGSVLTSHYTYADGESDAEGTSTYIWYRANSAGGADEAAIGSATSSTYTITNADTGKYISFSITPVAATGTTPGVETQSSRTYIPEPNYSAPAGAETSYENPLSIIQGAQISHDQEYITIPKNFAVNDDYVGQVYVNCTDSVFCGHTPNYTYSILSGNTGTAFKISTTGMLQVNTNTAVDSGTFTLSIKITDTVGTDRSDTITASILVVKACSDSTLFCDFGGAGTGTFNNPYGATDMASLTLTAGQNLFFKRGETFNQSSRFAVINKGSPTKSIRLGAYGQGDRPIFDGDPNNVHNGAILIGDLWTFFETDPDAALRTRYVELYDLDFTGYTTVSGDETNDAVHASPGCEYIELHRLRVSEANGNACIYFQRYSEVYNHINSHSIVKDCEAKDNTLSGHGFKFEGGGITGTNLWGTGNTANHFIDLTVWAAGNEVYYAYGDNDGDEAILMRHPKGVLRWAVLKGTGCIAIDQPSETAFHPDSCLVSDVYMDYAYTSYNYGAGVEFGNDASGSGRCSYDTIRRVIFKYTGTDYSGNGNIRFKYPSDNNTIEQCIFYSSSFPGIYINSTSVTNLKMKYNLFYDNTDYGIQIVNVGSGCYMRNNTFYNNTGDDIYQTSAQTTYLQNNIYQSVTGTFNSSTNYDSDLGDPYSDVDNDIFYLAAGVTPVDGGTYYEDTYDIMNNEVPIGLAPEIGAFEYVLLPTAGTRHKMLNRVFIMNY